MANQRLLPGIQVFAEAVDAGGFSAAADRLHLSRSAVGKTIARLERQLGVRLFNRTTRVQTLTDEGQLYYERCVRALAELDAARTMIEAGQNEAVGRLKVSVPILLGRRRVAPILTGLLADHPGLELELRFTDRIIDLIAEGFDLAIRNGPLGTSDGLSARRIGEERMILCAAPSFVERHGAPQSIPEVASYEAVTYARTTGRARWLLYGDAQEPLVIEPKTRLALDDLEAIAEAADAGFGVAWLPQSLVSERLAAGTLIDLFPGHRPHVYETFAVWPTTAHMPARLRIAIDALSRTLSRDS